MKKTEIENLKKEIKAPYEIIEREIFDIYGIGYKYIQISRIAEDTTKEYFWAMNTDGKKGGNWAIKKGGQFIERQQGYENAFKRIKELNEDQ